MLTNKRLSESQLCRSWIQK